MEESWPESWDDVEQSCVEGNNDVRNGERQVRIKLLLPRLADHEGHHACNYEHIAEQKGDVALSRINQKYLIYGILLVVDLQTRNRIVVERISKGATRSQYSDYLSRELNQMKQKQLHYVSD